MMASIKSKPNDLVTICLHWVMALMIFVLFGLGLYMVDLNYYHPWYRDAPYIHKSIGVCLFVLLCIRILWRVSRRSVIFDDSLNIQKKNIEEILATSMHYILYLMMALLCVSGYLISTAGGREIDVFSLFNVSALPVEIDKQEDIAGDWHYYLAWGIILMVCCHALAALKHHFIDRDMVLKNMLWPSKTKKEK